MKAIISCRACGMRLSLDKESLGRKVRCPKCKEVFRSEVFQSEVKTIEALELTESEGTFPAFRFHIRVVSDPDQELPAALSATVDAAGLLIKEGALRKEIRVGDKVRYVGGNRFATPGRRGEIILAIAQPRSNQVKLAHDLVGFLRGRISELHENDYASSRALLLLALLPLLIPAVAVLFNFALRMPEFPRAGGLYWTLGWGGAGVALGLLAAFFLRRDSWSLFPRVLLSLLLPLLGLAGFALALIMAPKLSIMDRQWLKTSTADGRLHWEMPGEPIKKATPVPGLENDSITNYELVTQSPHRTFTVTHAIVRKEELNKVLKAQRFEAALKGLIDAAPGVQTVKNESVEIDGHVGQEWVLAAPGQDTAVARCYIIGRHVVMLLVGGRGLKQEDPEVQRFISSLEFVEAPHTAPPAPEAPGLVAYWRFNEGRGDLISDTSASGFHLKAPDPGWSKGVEGAALKLGRIQSLPIPADGPFGFAAFAPFTIAGWVRTGAETGDVLWFGDQQTRFSLGVTEGKAFVRFETAPAHGREAFVVGPPINDGDWHHLAVTRNAGSAFEFFVDGRSIKRAYSPAAAGPLAGLAGHFGQLDSPALLDEWLVVNRELPADEVARLALQDAPASRPQDLVIGWFGAADLDFAADGKSLLTATSFWHPNPPWPGEVTIWDAGSRQARRTVAGFAPARFTADGAHVICLAPDLNLQIIETKTGKILPDRVSVGPIPKGSAWASLLVTADSKKLLWSVGDQAKIFELPTGRLEKSFKTAHADSRLLHFSPDGSRLIGAEGDKLKVFSFPSMTPEFEFEGRYFTSSVALSPDGRWLARGSAGGLPFAFFDALTGKKVAQRELPIGHRLAFSPNGRYLAGAFVGGKFSIIDMKTKSVTKDLQLKGQPVHAVFAPDGKTLAVVLAEEGEPVVLRFIDVPLELQLTAKEAADLGVRPAPAKLAPEAMLPAEEILRVTTLRADLDKAEVRVEAWFKDPQNPARGLSVYYVPAASLAETPTPESDGWKLLAGAEKLELKRIGNRFEGRFSARKTGLDEGQYYFQAVIERKDGKQVAAAPQTLPIYFGRSLKVTAPLPANQQPTVHKGNEKLARKELTVEGVRAEAIADGASPGQVILSPDGKKLFSLSAGAKGMSVLRRIALPDFEEELRAELPGSSMALSNEGIVLVRADRELWLIDPESLAVKARFILPNDVFKIAAQPQASTAVVGFRTLKESAVADTLAVLDLISGVLGSIHVHNDHNGQRKKYSQMLLSVDGQTLLTHAENGQLGRWRIDGLTPVPEATSFGKAGPREIFLALEHNGMRLCVGGHLPNAAGPAKEPGGLYLFRLDNLLKPTAQMSGVKDIRAPAFHSDGKVFASSPTETLLVFDASGKKLNGYEIRPNFRCAQIIPLPEMNRVLLVGDDCMMLVELAVK